MQWAIAMVGLVLVFLLAWGSRKPRLEPSCRKRRQEEQEHKTMSGFTRLKNPKKKIVQFEKICSSLHTMPMESLLPASKWLSDHARYLQEVFWVHCEEVKKLPSLPKSEAGEIRVLGMAKDMIAHRQGVVTDSDILKWISLWQEEKSLTVAEINALPCVFCEALLLLIVEMAQALAVDQKIQIYAEQTLKALKQQKNKKALNLFMRYQDRALYVQSLFAFLCQQEDTEPVLWFETQMKQRQEPLHMLIQAENDKQSEDALWMGNAITSLRFLSRLQWPEVLKSVSMVHQALRQDLVYEKMDRQSQAYYISRVAFFAKRCHQEEGIVCQNALALCKGRSSGDVRGHVGYYLLDEGQGALYASMQGLTFACNVRLWFWDHVAGLGRGLFWSTWIITVAFLVQTTLRLWIWVPMSVVVSFGVEQLWMTFCKQRAPVRMTPRMQVDALQPENQTLVVCPTMLLNEKQALAMVKKLSILYHANSDPHLHFMLLGDFGDSFTANTTADDSIIQTAKTAIEALCEETGHPFLYVQRERSLNPNDRIYMSRERKRGNLVSLFEWILGREVEDHYAYATVPLQELSYAYRYVITLDSDTILPPGSALQLVGAMLHPLQRRQLVGGRMHGVSIIQPRMETAIHGIESELSAVLGGTGGLDPYQTLTASFDHDACARASFVGKGIIDPVAFLVATKETVLPHQILSHDLLEGELSGCVMASDIVLYENHPATLQGFLLRLHRWTRGDWQLIRYAFSRLWTKKNACPLDRIGRWKIRRALLRTLIAPLCVLLLIESWITGKVFLMGIALLVPEITALIPFRFRSFLAFIGRVAMIPSQALICLDAIGRALYRMVFSKKNLLQWTPSAQTAGMQVPRQSVNPLHVQITFACVAVGLPLLFGKPLAWGMILGFLWLIYPAFLPFLEQPYHKSIEPTEYMREELLRLAKQTLSFFETAVTKEDHFLPPDNIQLEPEKGKAHRTSPTNIGLYLLSLLSAEALGIMPAVEVIHRIEDTINTLESLPKWKGNLYNWYDTQTLEPLGSFVSSVDSGNLVVCLMACAQGIRKMMGDIPEDTFFLSRRVDDLASQTALEALYDPSAELFWIGMDTSQNMPTKEHYDLLASESRMLSFVSIATGKVPLKHWFSLGRMETQAWFHKTLLSGSGTMFEYMMPLLLQPALRGTMMHQMVKGTLFFQSRVKKQGIFGMSESAYAAFDPWLNYQYKAFGVCALALGDAGGEKVIAPYATMLAMPVALKKCFANLKRLQSLGMEGHLGLYEAVDFAKERATGQASYQIIRSHMAHHQGMILCAIANVLCEGYVQSLFSHLPSMEAYRLLLEEKPLPLQFRRSRMELRRDQETKMPKDFASRQAKPLCLPVDAHVLSGGDTTMLIDAQGGGYLQRKGIMMTRFDESCQRPSGIRFYVRDAQTGHYDMLTNPHTVQKITFDTAAATFMKDHNGFKMTLCMFVSPLDGVVVHHVEIENKNDVEKLMELCSYLEPALAPQKEDSAHYAFQNLTITTSRPFPHGLCATCQPKDGALPKRRLWHLMQSDTPYTVFHMQTNRTAFLGRGGTIYAPREMERAISSLANQVGVTIEPCLSLRGQFVLLPHAKASFVFATHLADENERAELFAERYAQMDHAMRCKQVALTKGLVSAQFLHMNTQEQNFASQLVGALAYGQQIHSFDEVQNNQEPITSLWALGVSGDLPLLVLVCDGADEWGLVSKLLKAHAQYRMSGFWVDLVLLCMEPEGFEKPMMEHVQALVHRGSSQEWLNQAGGVHVINCERVTDERYALLLSAANLLFYTSHGEGEDQFFHMQQMVHGKPTYQHKRCTQWEMILPDTAPLHFENGYGGFTQTEGDYVITLAPMKHTPAPWCNPLCSDHFGTLAGESGLVFNYVDNSQLGRITRWPNDSVYPMGEEQFYVRDPVHCLLWTLTRLPMGQDMPVRITHATGETTYESHCYGIRSKIQCFTDTEDAMGFRVITLRNEDQVERTLSLFHTVTFEWGQQPLVDHQTKMQADGQGIYVRNTNRDGVLCLAGIDPAPSQTYTMSAGAFQGLWGTAPYALTVEEPLQKTQGNVGILCFQVVLKAGQSKVITTALGHGVSLPKAKRMLDNAKKDGATLRLVRVRQFWQSRLGVLHYDLPDAALCVLLNKWLPYQVWASRLMMKAGFYQAGGATGFRDQLQDMLCLLHTSPQTVRKHLLTCASHQFEEGDVQHWWHEPAYGVRTRISDDLLFLPYLTALYVEATADSNVLFEERPYVQDAPLAPMEKERLAEATFSSDQEPLWQHCLRAIDHVQMGAHGLPLMGTGDWNDGMNEVGGSNGESVWLGMFYAEVVRLFAPFCMDEEARETMLCTRQEVLQNLERFAWEGSWYARAFAHDGTRLGTTHAKECCMDLLPQSFSVLAGLSKTRSYHAMQEVWKYLYDPQAGLMKLFTPPFEGQEKPGYIASYVPGIRENGGQYTHALGWAIWAYHQIGQQKSAWDLALSILPIYHADSKQRADRYRVEPYVMAGDVYANPSQRGRGGWTWYTGSASWYQYVMLTKLLGFEKVGAMLTFHPIVPAHWDSVSLTYQYGTATYHLHASRQCTFPNADGEALPDGKLLLRDDGRIHEAKFPLEVIAPHEILSR